MRDNGMMLRSQYIHGYWLNKDGSCTYKPVAKWRKDAVGVYYQDTAGYQQQNSIVAIGSGQLTGKGYKNNEVGSVKNGNFISAAHTEEQVMGFAQALTDACGDILVR